MFIKYDMRSYAKCVNFNRWLIKYDTNVVKTFSALMRPTKGLFDLCLTSKSTANYHSGMPSILNGTSIKQFLKHIFLITSFMSYESLKRYNNI